MNLIDVIALAKAGYSKKDIEKIRAEENEQFENGEEVIDVEINETETDDGKAEDIEIDYKALYESAEKTIKEKDDLITSLQKANTEKDISGQKHDLNKEVKDSLNALI